MVMKVHTTIYSMSFTIKFEIRILKKERKKDFIADSF
jgi:hypothetical protein